MGLADIYIIVNYRHLRKQTEKQEGEFSRRLLNNAYRITDSGIYTIPNILGTNNK